MTHVLIPAMRVVAAWTLTSFMFGALWWAWRAERRDTRRVRLTEYRRIGPSSRACLTRHDTRAPRFTRDDPSPVPRRKVAS